MTYNIGDIFKNDNEYFERAKWANENNAKISFYEDRLEEVTKTRQVEKTEPERGTYYEEETYTEQELVRYYQLVSLPTITLDELKTQKREEINQARDAAEQGGFEYMGKIFDSDQVSCLRISTAAQAMALAPEESAIVWTCQDNTTISLNKTQLAGMVSALAMHSNTCHQKATALKAEIDKAKTAEELEKITWSDQD